MASEFSLVGVLVHGLLQLVESAGEGRSVGLRVRGDEGHPGPDQPRITPREKQGDAQSMVGDPITVRSWLPLEQPVQAQSPQLVSQLALGALAGIFAPQLGQVRPQIFVTKSTGKQTKQQQQVKQREHHRVGVAQAGDTLLAHLLGRRDLAKRGFAQQASVAGLVPVAASVDRR